VTPIMLVTADKEMARWVKSALKDTAVKVAAECSSSKAAGEEIAKGQIDMVILDLFLPESSGLEILKNLKKINDKCVCLILSRMRTRMLLERSLRLGAQDVLLYPLSAETFRDTVIHRATRLISVENETFADLPPKQGREKN